MQPAVHIISTLAAKLARISGAHVVHPIAGQYCDDRLIPEEHQKQDKLLLYLTGCDTCVTRCGLWERHCARNAQSTFMAPATMGPATPPAGGTRTFLALRVGGEPSATVWRALSNVQVLVLAWNPIKCVKLQVHFE